MTKNNKKFIEGIRADYTSNTNQRTIDGYRNALAVVANTLFESDVHFVFELIQNADDNSYKPGCTPELSFEIENNKLIIRNNELGFSEPNVESLCTVGNSTKNKEQGYIGEKGIGFKSVFKKTDNPQIYSNNFFFELNVPDENDENDFGYIVPKWIDNPEYKFTGTTIVLPAKKGETFTETDFNKFKPESLLFLRRLKKITYPSNGGSTEVKNEQKGISSVITLKSQSESSKQEYKSISATLDMSSIQVKEREGVNKTEITFAFKYENSEPVNERFQVFNYLPIRDFGLGFILQADFITTASREDIVSDSQWTKYIINSIPAIFVKKILPQIKDDPILSKIFYCYLDTNSGQDERLKPMLDDIALKLIDEASILSESDRWCKPKNLLLRKHLRPGLISNTDLHFLIEKEFVSDKISHKCIKYLVQSLDVEDSSNDYLIKFLENEVWVKSHIDDNDWFHNLYMQMNSEIRNLKEGESEEFCKDLKKLKIFKTTDGELLSTDGKEKIFFSLGGDKNEYNFTEDFDLIDKKTFPDDWTDKENKEFFTRLGIKKENPKEIIKTIAEIHKADSAINHEKLIEHMAYILKNKDCLDDDFFKENNLKLLSNKDQTLEASNIYLGETYGNKDFNNLFLEAGIDTPFVSARYFEDNEIPVEDWSSFFDQLNISKFFKIKNVELYGTYDYKKSTKVLGDFDFDDYPYRLLDKNIPSITTKLFNHLGLNWNFYKKYTTAQLRLFSRLRNMPLLLKDGKTSTLEDMCCVENNETISNPNNKFLDIENNFDESFYEYWGVIHKVDLKSKLNDLKLMCKGKEINEEEIFRLYKEIDARLVVEGEDSKILTHDSFKENKLIYLKKNLYKASEVRLKSELDDTNKIFQKYKPSLNHDKRYLSSDVLFSSELIQEDLEDNNIIELVKIFPFVEFEIIEKNKAAGLIYEYISENQLKLNNMCFWTDNEKQEVIDPENPDIYINDLPKIGDLFTPKKGFSFLAVEPPYKIKKLDWFIDHNKLPKLSDSIDKKLPKDLVKELSSEHSKQLTKRAHSIQTMIYRRYKKSRFNELNDEGKFKILTSKIYIASPLELKISLKEIIVQAPDNIVYIEGVIYINKGVNLHLYLSKLLAEEFRLEDAADTIENILRAEDGADLEERMVDYPELEGTPKKQLLNLNSIEEVEAPEESASEETETASEETETASEETETASEETETASEETETASEETGKVLVDGGNGRRDKSEATLDGNSGNRPSSGERNINSEPYPYPVKSKKQYKKRGIYVLQFKDSKQEKNHTFQKDEINKVDSAAMNAVMQEEENSGYSPERQTHYNPGFDIISKKDTDTRYIEVKGSKYAWGNTGVELSHMQMEHASKKGDAYWVYVVENALDAPKIHKIQNVHKLIDIYRFDGSWQKVAEQDELTDFEIGAIVINQKRRGTLKNWEPHGELIRLFIEYEDKPGDVSKEVWNPLIMKLDTLDNSDNDT